MHDAKFRRLFVMQRMHFEGPSLGASAIPRRFTYSGKGGNALVIENIAPSSADMILMFDVYRCSYRALALTQA